MHLDKKRSTQLQLKVLSEHVFHDEPALLPPPVSNQPFREGRAVIGCHNKLKGSQCMPGILMCILSHL